MNNWLSRWLFSFCSLHRADDKSQRGQNNCLWLHLLAFSARTLIHIGSLTSRIFMLFFSHSFYYSHLSILSLCTRSFLQFITLNHVSTFSGFLWYLMTYLGFLFWCYVFISLHDILATVYRHSNHKKKLLGLYAPVGIL